MIPRRRALALPVLVGLVAATGCSSSTTRAIEEAARDVDGVARIEVTAQSSFLSNAALRLELSPGLTPEQVTAAVAAVCRICDDRDWVGALTVRPGDHPTALLRGSTTRPPVVAQTTDWLTVAAAVAGAVSIAIPDDDRTGLWLDVETGALADDLRASVGLPTTRLERWQFREPGAAGAYATPRPADEDVERWERLVGSTGTLTAPVTELTWAVARYEARLEYRPHVRLTDDTEPSELDPDPIVAALLPLFEVARLTRAEAERIELLLEVKLRRFTDRLETIGSWRSVTGARIPAAPLNQALARVLPLGG